MTTKVRDTTQINFDGISTGQIGFLGASALIGSSKLTWDNTGFIFNIGGFLDIDKDITWNNDTGFGLVSFVGGIRFLSYTSAGGLALGSGAAVSITATNLAKTAFSVRFNASNPLIGFCIANSNGFGYFGWNTKSQVSSDIPTYDINGAAAQIRGNNATGSIIFATAPSGTAGGAITLTDILEISTTGLNLFQTINKYKNIATAGLGVPAIYASGRITAQTVGGTVATFTPAADGSFIISGAITVTAYTSGTASLRVTWTDEGSNSNILGIASISATGQGSGTDIHIRAKGGTTITISTTNGVATYNAEGYIIQVG